MMTKSTVYTADNALEAAKVNLEATRASFGHTDLAEMQKMDP
jgi:hypothetical protein